MAICQDCDEPIREHVGKLQNRWRYTFRDLGLRPGLANKAMPRCESCMRKYVQTTDLPLATVQPAEVGK